MLPMLFFGVLAACQVCRSETKNVVPQLSESAKEMYPHIIWGEFTNGIRAGVYLRQIQTITVENDEQISLRPIWQFYPVFEGGSKNSQIFWIEPQQSWSVKLTSTTGKEIKRTRAGKQFGQKMFTGKNGLQSSVFVFTRVDSICPSIIGKGINVTTLFVLNDPGDYTLEVSFCGMAVTNSATVPTYFASIKANLRYAE